MVQKAILTRSKRKGHAMAKPSARQRRVYLDELLHQHHYTRLRGLPVGTPLMITVRDDDVLRFGEMVTIVRHLRKPSTRIAVQRTDGETWDVPMVWLAYLPDLSEG